MVTATGYNPYPNLDVFDPIQNPDGHRRSQQERAKTPPPEPAERTLSTEGDLLHERSPSFQAQADLAAAARTPFPEPPTSSEVSKHHLYSGTAVLFQEPESPKSSQRRDRIEQNKVDTSHDNRQQGNCCLSCKGLSRRSLVILALFAGMFIGAFSAVTGYMNNQPDQNDP